MEKKFPFTKKESLRISSPLIDLEELVRVESENSISDDRIFYGDNVGFSGTALDFAKGFCIEEIVVKGSKIHELRSWDFDGILKSSFIRRKDVEIYFSRKWERVGIGCLYGNTRYARCKFEHGKLIQLSSNLKEGLDVSALYKLIRTTFDEYNFLLSLSETVFLLGEGINDEVVNTLLFGCFNTNNLRELKVHHDSISEEKIAEVESLKISLSFD